ncbi:exodeoxyribonuclease III [Candidatus Saccharibacteria bacterium]|nr:exodeoxyribonuclease III [Candidatus Saccharibacteria bacterium]
MSRYSIFSWNVNGLRAVLRKGDFQQFIEKYQPDLLCLQETKARRDQTELDLPDYIEIWHSADRPGYAGTAIFAKTELLPDFREPSVLADLPLAGALEKSVSDNPYDTPPGEDTRVHLGFIDPLDAADQFGDPCREGRVTTLELPEFYLVTVYTPNSKNALERLNLRSKKWDPAFLNYLQELEKVKPVVTCGDFNAAHAEIDLARPKTNHHNAGFTDEERQGITNLLNAGFIDTFRSLNPDVQRYTWWSHWGHARENNVGWRIDYFFISESLKNHLKSAEIYESQLGSDHCPISIELEF